MLSRSSRVGIGLSVGLALLLVGSAANAQDASDGGSEEGIATEVPDATRLDVERLPPEAIELTREMYSHGFFLQAMLGARGFIGGLGDVSDPGPFAALSFGYELTDWLHVSVTGEASMHQTNAPPPPGTTAFELMGASVDVRLQIDWSAQFATWVTLQGGILVATTDVLTIYGIQNATTVGPFYGGELGFDGHFKNRHNSIGVAGGVRHYPSLEGVDGAAAIGIHGVAYLRYVF